MFYRNCSATGSCPCRAIDREARLRGLGRRIYAADCAALASLGGFNRVAESYVLPFVGTFDYFPRRPLCVFE